MVLSWNTDDGRHEGYVLPEFSDGVRGRAMSGGGVADDQVIVGVEYVGEPGAITDTRYTTRPAAEVVGWRIMCDCRLQESRSTVTEQWSSELLVRVPSNALEDIGSGRVFVADEDVPDVAVRAGFVERWRREHVEAGDAEERIRQARAQVAEAERRLDSAVGSAREAGASWEIVGRAAGMARQSAHARWGRPTP